MYSTNKPDLTPVPDRHLSVSPYEPLESVGRSINRLKMVNEQSWHTCLKSVVRNTLCKKSRNKFEVAIYEYVVAQLLRLYILWAWKLDPLNILESTKISTLGKPPWSSSSCHRSNIECTRLSVQTSRVAFFFSGYNVCGATAVESELTRDSEESRDRETRGPFRAIFWTCFALKFLPTAFIFLHNAAVRDTNKRNMHSQLNIVCPCALALVWTDFKSGLGAQNSEKAASGAAGNHKLMQKEE